MVRNQNGSFLLNRNRLVGQLTKLKKLKSNYGIWITNPIYSAGITYTKEDLEFLRNLFKSHPRLNVFADESFSFSSSELLRDFSTTQNFFQFTIHGNSFVSMVTNSRSLAIAEYIKSTLKSGQIYSMAAFLPLRCWEFHYS